MNKCVISVGSNIEPHKNVKLAENILREEHTLIDIASYITTSPVGFQEQDDFLNGAFYVATAIDMADFNQYLKKVEIRLNRKKGPIKSGPRTIDLDIIIWNDKVVHDEINQDYVRIPIEEIVNRNGLANFNLQE